MFATAFTAVKYHLGILARAWRGSSDSEIRLQGSLPEKGYRFAEALALVVKFITVVLTER